MAVPEQIPVVNYVADGVVKKFDVTFEYDQQSDLHVYVNGVEPTIDKYFFADNSFNFYIAPTIGQGVKIKRITPKERDTDYNLHTNTVRPKALNTDFDRLWYVLQEVFSDVGGLSQAVQDEIIARIQGDEDLLNQLTTEISARMLGDEAVTEDLKNYVDQVIGAIINDPDFDGIDADKVNDASGETQQQVNYNGGSKWHSRVGGYKLNERVVLTNGDIVKSTIDGNTNDPNVDVTGWRKPQASEIFDESGLSQQEINEQAPSVLTLAPLVKGDGVSSDSAALQVLATQVDTQLKPYMFFPFYNNSYRFSSTVTLQEPMMLWGDAVPTYNRGNGKKGKILLDTLVGFNLGNGRTNGPVTDISANVSSNPADQWTIKNLAFLPFDDATQNRTQVALLHDSKTNGPDRGFIMREVSGRGLKHVIEVKDNDVQTHLANFVVENCCLSNNYIPIFAGANVWNGRIVGNQIEQNSEGCIHGVFHAGLTIHDNMLEGSKNTIYIKDHPEDRDGCYLSLERNYFEANKGEYLVKIESFNRNSIVSRGNYVSGFLGADGVTPSTEGIKPVDHFLLTNNYTSINIYDALSTTFFGLSSVLKDNNLARFLIYSQPTNMCRVMTELDDAVLLPDAAATVNMTTKINTDVGELYELRQSNLYTQLPLALQANDVIQLVFSYYTDNALLHPTNITIVEAGGVTLLSGVGFGTSSERYPNKVQTANFIFTVPAKATGGKNIMFNLTTNIAGQNFSVLGATAKKIGTYNSSAVNPTDNRFVISKSKPVLRKVSDGLKYNVSLPETTIAAGASSVKTYTLAGATSINRVEAVIAGYDANLTVTARVSAADTIQVTIKNNGASSIVIAAGSSLSYAVY